MRVDFSEKLIEQRTQVRKFILSGHIEEAIILLNDISPIVSNTFLTDYQILDRNPELNFELLKQQLIEIIKAQKVEEAIKFAQTNIKILPKTTQIRPKSLKFVSAHLNLIIKCYTTIWRHFWQKFGQNFVEPFSSAGGGDEAPPVKKVGGWLRGLPPIPPKFWRKFNFHRNSACFLSAIDV